MKFIPFFQVILSRIGPQETRDLQDWRNRLVRLTILLTMFALPISSLPSMLVFFAEGRYGLIAFDLGVWLFLIFRVFFVSQRSSHINYILWLAILYIMTVTYYVELGPHYARSGWLVMCAVMATLLYGVRGTVVATAVNGGILFLLYWVIPPLHPAWAAEFSAPPNKWTMFVMNISLITLVTGLPIGFLLSRLDHSLKQIQESEEKYRLLADNATDVILTFSLETLRFTYASPSVLQMSGYTPQEILELTPERIISPESLEQLKETLQEELARENQEGVDPKRSRTLEVKQLGKNGSYRWAEVTLSFIRNAEGRPVEILGVTRDITERRLAEEALRKSEEKYRDIFERAVEGIFQSTPEGKFISVNPSLASMLGYESPQELVTSIINIREQLYVDPEQRLRFARAFEETGTVMGFETQLFRKDGGKIWVSFNGRSVSDSDGRILYYEGNIENITERRLAEEALRQSEEYFRSLIENASDIILIVDQEGIITCVSPSVERIMGYKPNELVGKSGFDFIHPADLSRAFDDFVKAILTRELNIPNAFRVRHKDGSERILEGVGKNLLGDKIVAGFIMNVHDATVRRQAEEELQKLASVVRHSKELISLATLDGKMTFLNEAGMNMLGIEPGEVIRTHVFQVIPEHLHELVRTEFLPTLLKKGSWEGELQYLNLKSGKLTDVHAMTFTINEPATGAPLYLANVSLDISEQKKAERRLKESEERYRTVADFTYDWEQWIAPDKKFLYVSPSCRRITGYQAQDFIDNPGLFLKLIHPEDYQAVKTHFHDRLDDSNVEHFEFRILRKDGEERWISHSCQPIYNAEGQWLGRRASNRDITERKKLEEHLRQAQRMEAVGALAGGLAHDFNNLLTPILMGAEMVQSAIPPESSDWNNLGKVIEAAHRAGELVRQILIFSRQGEKERGPLRVIPLVKETLKHIETSLPPTIEMKRQIEAVSDVVTANPAEIHRIVMNLCTNAVQAMSKKGGLLEIGLTNEKMEFIDPTGSEDLKPGDYIKISVRDTGHGMDNRTRRKIFDPFFSTTGRREGSGMGLAVVHGTIKSLGGTITVESELGKGTTFRVYLPCAQRPIGTEMKK